MVRPIKWRRIENLPEISYFIPSEQNIAEAAGKKMIRNILKFEELEAIRLKDLLGLEQSECAEKMEISRPTFQRILLVAREKIADSLVNGKMIHIEGGNYTQNICPVKCMDCDKEWMESFENLESLKKGEYLCPACGSANIACGQNCRGKFGRGNCRRHRQV